MLSIVNVLALSVIPVSFVAGALWAEQVGVGLFSWWTLPVWIVFAGTLLLRGLVSFFPHYLNHRLPLLWRLHRVHHLDKDLNISSTVGFHPLKCS